MKKFSLIAVLIGTISLTLTSCDEDEDGAVTSDSGNVIVSDNITADETWTQGNVYELAGRITVEDGATLTIEGGVIVKGQLGTGANATALLVARGGTLNANGTATAPIIFTTIGDEITPEMVEAGNFASPNLDPNAGGLWGGVIILGKANISAQNENDQDVSEIQIEGIPLEDTNGLYGGNEDGDNSGTIAYISIRHGGTNIGAGNEINGLSLGGVGSGTTIQNVEVVANADDGIEWFGGTVDVDGALIWNSGDDGLDTDQAWNGTCSNYAVVTPVGGSAFELDGPEGSYLNGPHQFNDGTVFAGANIDHLVDWDGNTNAGINGLYIFGLDAQYVYDGVQDGFSFIESFGGDGSGNNGNWEYTFVAGSASVDDDGDEETDPVAFSTTGITANDVFSPVPAAALSSVSEGSNTVGTSADYSWTWPGSINALPF